LVVHQRQNGKNRIRSYCYGTAVAAQRQVETATAQRNFSRKQRNSYGGYVILTEFTKREQQNGNGRTATEWWKPGIKDMKTIITITG